MYNIQLFIFFMYIIYDIFLSYNDQLTGKHMVAVLAEHMLQFYKLNSVAEFGYLSLRR